MQDDDIELIDDEENKGISDPVEKLKKLKEKLHRSEKEKVEYLEGWQRAKADLVNSRRDEEKRLHEWRERLEGDIILEFISAIDIFDLALAEKNRGHLKSESEKGFMLIRSQFADVLKRLDVESVKAAEEKFDPAIHEAIEEVPDDAPAGTIIDELQKGYMRRGVLLRPARVKVSKGKDVQN